MPPPTLVPTSGTPVPSPVIGNLGPQDPYELEIERLRRDMQTLPESSAIAGGVSSELDRLRRLEAVLEQKYRRLAREGQLERDRSATIELVTRNEPRK